VLHHPAQVRPVVLRIACTNQCFPGLVSVAAADVGLAQLLPVARVIAEEGLHGLDEFEGFGAPVLDDQALGQSDRQLVGVDVVRFGGVRKGYGQSSQRRLESLVRERFLEQSGGRWSGVRWFRSGGGG
jgi:hypothetical protein